MTQACASFRPNHFRADVPVHEARELFWLSVNYVEIETFSYCNRKCWFCPNAKIPQRQDRAGNQYMDRSLYARIIDELRSIDYRGSIQFGRYNEPLADRCILDRILQAREQLASAYLYTHTNGDFLTREYLDELRRVGLNGLEIQTYLGNSDRYDEDAMIERQDQQLDRLGLNRTKVASYAPGFRLQYETDYPGMDVRIDARNFYAIGTDRGGLLPIRQTTRTAPCFVPFNAIYIDYDGSTMPCCNLRSDVPEHAQYVACRLQDGHSIFDAYLALRDWRLSLMRVGEKSGPCSTCRYDETEVSPEQAAALDGYYQLALNA